MGREEDSQMSCKAFQAQLPDLMGSIEDIADHPHVQKCVLCRALLADLEKIAQNARNWGGPQGWRN
jgi:hypothetical protein